jgi:hypothetical protein
MIETYGGHIGSSSGDFRRLLLAQAVLIPGEVARESGTMSPTIPI